MKNVIWVVVCLTTMLLLNGSLASGLSTDFVWAARAGGVDQDCGEAIAADGSGNIVVTGYFADTATFEDTTLVSAGRYDIFIAKYDGAGNLLWVTRTGGTDNENATSIAMDSSNNIIVVGGFSGTTTIGDSTFVSAGGSDVFVAKYDEGGDFLWAVQAGGGGLADNGLGVAVDDSGNVIATGSFYGTATFGDTTLISEGSLDIFAVKYDGAGNFIWAVQAGGMDQDSGYDIATDDSGSVLITGYFRGTATFGDTVLVPAGYRDAFIAKYDRSGDFVWVAQAGGTGSTWGYGIAVDGSGDVIATGEFGDMATFGDSMFVSIGSYDIFITKYAGAGDFIWAAQAGGTADDDGWDIVADDSGNITVTGRFSGTAILGDTALVSPGSYDIFAAQYDDAGGFVWAARAGGVNEDGGFSIAVDDSGKAAVAGYFSYEATFGDTTLVSAGEYDIFVGKLGVGSTGIEG